MQSSNAVTNFQSMTASHNVNSVLSLISFDYSTPVFPQSNTYTKQNACKMFFSGFTNNREKISKQSNTQHRWRDTVWLFTLKKLLSSKKEWTSGSIFDKSLDTKLSLKTINTIKYIYAIFIIIIIENSFFFSYNTIQPVSPLFTSPWYSLLPSSPNPLPSISL